MVPVLCLILLQPEAYVLCLQLCEGVRVNCVSVSLLVVMHQLTLICAYHTHSLCGGRVVRPAEHGGLQDSDRECDAVEG